MVSHAALILLAGGFAATLTLEWLTLLASRRLALLAHPNLRSFHEVPTPTGGGVAFVLPVLGYLLWVATLNVPAAAALAGAAAAVAAVGLWDDVREVSARLRIVVHALAALAVVWSIFPDAAWPLLGVVAFALVWHLNLYNFMDGIDGIAAAQALVLLVGAQLVGGGLPGWGGDAAWLASGCLMAFLAFNWPPARIFMGDVGSGFLGILTGALVLLWWQQGTLPLVAALILLSGFWFDASYTLIVRLLSGQAFTQAHRSHLYQKVAAKRGHLWTTVGFLFYALAWLLPLSWLCARYTPELSLTGLLWLVPAVAPLAFAAPRLGAGLPER